MTASLDSAAVSPSVAPRPAVAQCVPPLVAIASRVVIDLAAVVHNGRCLAQVAGMPWTTAVKADACGHGPRPVALTTLSAGIPWLGVAQLAEALTLRALLDEAGMDRPVGEPTLQAPRLLTQLLPVMEPDRVAAKDSLLRAVLAADLDLSVPTLPQLEALSAAARAQGRAARPYLKADIGMSRGSATAEELPALAAVLRRAEDEGIVDVAGLWSHLSRVDEPASGSTEEHLEYYRQAEQVALATGLNPPTHHLAATGGFLWYPQACMDLMRAGIGMYGLSPDLSVAAGAELGLRPAMRLESPLVQVEHIEAGQAVPYGGTWSAPTDRWVGLVPLGYSDGIPCTASPAGPVGVSSLMTSVVGRVRMDQVAIDLGPIVDGTGVPLPAAARAGDTVVFWGAPAVSDQETVLTADEWVQAYGIINYEIVI